MRNIRVEKFGIREVCRLDLGHDDRAPPHYRHLSAILAEVEGDVVGRWFRTHHHLLRAEVRRLRVRRWVNHQTAER